MNPTVPYEDPGKWSSLLLTVLMHGLLALALVVSVRWQTRHETVAVELWVPPPPAPRPAEPVAVPKPPEPAPAPAREPPPPAKPDIALKPDKPKPAAKPEPPKKADKPAPKQATPAPNFDNLLAREDQRIDRIREERDRQARAEQEAEMLARAKADAQAQAQRTARERALASYADKVRGKIRGNLVQPPGLKGNPTVRFVVSQLPNGEVLDVRLRKASGNTLYDDAVERAIRKSSPLPLPDDRALFEREFEIIYCPDPDQSGRCPR